MRLSVNGGNTDDEVEIERNQGDGGLPEVEKLPSDELDMVERDGLLDEKQKFSCSICPKTFRQSSSHYSPKS